MHKPEELILDYVVTSIASIMIASCGLFRDNPCAMYVQSDGQQHPYESPLIS